MCKLFVFLISSSPFLFAQTDSNVTIEINSNYRNALVFLDDQETGFTTPCQIPNIRTGQHKINLKWNDLLNQSEYVAEESINVTRHDSNKFLVEFRPVSVTIVCNAEHTKLYLNGNLRGDGNDLVIEKIIPGTYNLRLKQNFGLNAEKQVYFPPNSTDCPPECFVFGNLHVVSEEIDNVPIFINGIKTDKLLPATFSNLIIGEYEVSAELKGKRISKKVVVKRNEENYVRINPKQIEKELKEQKIARKKTLKQAQVLQEEKEAAERELQRSKEALKPKEKLVVLFGITTGLNGSYYGKLFATQSIQYGNLNFGAFIGVPMLDLFYIQNEVRYFPKKYNYDVKNSYDQYKIDISYLYDFLLLRKNIQRGIYVMGGCGFGMKIRSKKILFDDIDGVSYYYKSDKSNDVAWTMGFGFDPSHDFAVETRFTRSITKFNPVHSQMNIHPKTISLNVAYLFDLPFLVKK